MTQVVSEGLFKQFKVQGFNFFVGVPCSNLAQFLAELTADVYTMHVPAVREDVALALAVGAYMAGRKPLVYLQSSGLGHLVNPITSLLTPYGISIHLLISVRTEPFEHYEMLRITKDLLKLLRYHNFTLLYES